MLTVVYLANQFPVAVEPYVVDEILELETRGVQVVAASVRRSALSQVARSADVVLFPLSIPTIFRALWLCVRRVVQLGPLFKRIILLGNEDSGQRCKALAHTFLGACLAVRLRARGVQHIHVHHGYFGSWVGMTAARLMGAGFSFTLHGSDLLLHRSYLDTKLAACDFCCTVSEYNRRFIAGEFPQAQDKVLLSPLGVDAPPVASPPIESAKNREGLRILAVGRLQPVKDHAFLVRACARLAELGIPFDCSIAGDGPERSALELLIQESHLARCVHLLGHVAHEDLGALYDSADVVVLTSKSEGIPLVLMEAMARSRVVLAPRITGIPELVIPCATGFLYEAGNMDDFLGQVLAIRTLIASDSAVGTTEPFLADPLATIRQAAHQHVVANFNRAKNLHQFANLFLTRLSPRNENAPDENLILQQI